MGFDDYWYVVAESGELTGNRVLARCVREQRRQLPGELHRRAAYGVRGHHAIFRSSRAERLTATVSCERGEVHVRYRNERANLGTYAWFLNPGGGEIAHTDSFTRPMSPR